MCIACQISPPPFDGLRAAYVYEGVARGLVHSLKYRGVTALGAPIGSLCVAALQEQALQFEVIVPVPLHSMRKRTRGYNQAQLLARHIGQALGVPVESRALERCRRTPQQARSADAEERQRNVAGAFRGWPGTLEGRAVLLVDDVTTTGATLAACAQALKEAGDGWVWAFAFARED
jgi:ComF family protein